MSVIVKAEHLCCQSGRRYLVHDVNWEINKGDRWIVFGVNGSGKTTLLSTIAGFKNHTSGCLEVFGETYSEDNVFDLRKRIGWVSSSFFDKYFTRESALDIVLGGVSGTLGVRGCVTDQDVVRAKALLRQFRLGDRVNQPFSLMSKGERQCVLIARALISDPDVLILDEPGTGLDIYAREFTLQAIADLAESTDITIIYVTHYAEEILPMFDKTLLLRNGSVYTKGATKDVFTTETMNDFLGCPAHVDWNADSVSISVEALGSYRDASVKMGVW